MIHLHRKWEAYVAIILHAYWCSRSCEGQKVVISFMMSLLQTTNRSDVAYWTALCPWPSVTFKVIRILLFNFSYICAALENCHWHAIYVTRSSAIAERPTRHAMSVEILANCCTNNANRCCVSLSSTFSNCHILFRYLHSFHTRIIQVSHGVKAMRWVSSTNPCTTNLVATGL